MEMISCHFNVHLLIPGECGTCRYEESIRQKCAEMMYEWYNERNYFKFRAYLYVNWYKPEQSKLWARPANTDEITLLKTTMVFESHWRRVKHDFLHMFNRPRIDFLFWTLTSQWIPQGINKTRAIQKGDHRTVSACWRKFLRKSGGISRNLRYDLKTSSSVRQIQ